jgi:hypothetical protein
MKSWITFLACTFGFLSLKAQDFYDLNQIQKIEVFFSQPDWDYQLDTLKVGSDGYLAADSVKVNGSLFTQVGVKYKGNSSYNASNSKNPLHLSLNEWVSQTYNGVKSIKLGNGYADPSMIREVLSYSIAGHYMDCPRSNFAQVYINGDYLGLYSNTESIDKTFCSSHFYSNSGTFIKCNPILNPSPSTKSNLKFINSDSSSYFNYYEVKSTVGWNDLTALCDSTSNNVASMEHLMDMDRWIWMLAFDNVLVNLDSYMGVFAQNYYLYRDLTGKYNPVLWDVNMSFGGFPYLGAGNTSMAALTTTQLQQMPLNVHSTDVYWPVIKTIQNNPQYKRMYHAHCKTILNEFFSNADYLTLAQGLQATVDTAVFSDNNAFYSYTDFQQALNTSISVGNYDVPGIQTLMDARSSYLLGTSELSAEAPTVSNVSSNITPVLNQDFSITASVSNAQQVYLGYRFDYTQHFQRVEMFDDGLHNDGAANDFSYGINLNLSGAMMQYYVYAENSNAGIFSPARAEHEFYTLLSGSPMLTPGQVVINEVVSQNTSGATDEAGEFEDWIELYNNTGQPLNLNGLFLSDDPNLPQKHSIHQDLIIPAYSWMALWADQDVNVSARHLNFKLAAAGEPLFLSNSAGVVLDSLTLDSLGADQCIGRCPDGTGEFTTTLAVTFEYNNCPMSVSHYSFDNCIVYPNPIDDQCILYFGKEGENSYRVFDAEGRQLLAGNGIGPSAQINTSNWDSGLYCIQTAGGIFRVIKR